MSKSNVKTGNEVRENKVAASVVNDNSEIAKQAAKEAAEKHEARAKAVGLDADASEEEIAEAERAEAEKAQKAEDKRQKELKDKNHKLWVMQNTVNQLFAERSKTNLPGVTETEVRSVLGKQGAGVKITFNYSNEDKTSGSIDIEEFDHKVTCPLKGEFTFGIDYAAIAKANQAK